MKTISLMIQTFFVVSGLCVLISNNLYCTTRSSLRFAGKATGGTLILGRMGLYDMRYLSIETRPGESAESVASRLAAQITANHSNADLPRIHKLWSGSGSQASGTNVEVQGSLSHYFLAGLERGLGIPEAPLYLTCNYDEQENIVKVAWENPSDGYEKIFISLEWGHGGHLRKESISGNSTTYLVDRNCLPVDVKDLCIAVVGFRNGLVSAPGAMHVNDLYQDESGAVPSAMGILPNWGSWRVSLSAPGASLVKNLRADATDFLTWDSYRLDVMDYTPDMGLQLKPFYQIIKADFSGVVGLQRKFLGLTPGHTYRITGALSTLQMHKSGSDWSLDICAAHNGPGGRELAPEQLAGKSPLPNGKMGRRAGRIAVVERGDRGRKITGTLTGPGFRLVKSKARDHDRDEEGTDITLPPGVDTLTVWIRFECLDPAGAVGFMGVGIEDITAGQP